MKVKVESKRQIKKRVAEIESEINGYDCSPSIASAMRTLGELGFSFSGHGVGGGGEDFNLVKDHFYFNLCDRGRKKVASIYNNSDEDFEDSCIFEGTIKSALKYIVKCI